jgi:uncharacterized membrane protein YtjA (UPF0391 family)
MYRWALFFLVLVGITAALAFTTILGAAIGIAKFFFFVFLALFLIALGAGWAVGRKIDRFR